MPDISNFTGEITPQEKQAPQPVKPGRYDLECRGANDQFRTNDKGWVGMQLNFKIANSEVDAWVSHLVTIDHPDAKVKSRGRRDLELMSSAMGVGPWKETDALMGKVASCKVKLNDNGYPEVDSYFGENWQKASGSTKKEKPAEQAAAPAPAPVENKVDAKEDIPF